MELGIDLTQSFPFTWIGKPGQRQQMSITASLGQVWAHRAIKMLPLSHWYSVTKVRRNKQSLAPKSGTDSSQLLVSAWQTGFLGGSDGKESTGNARDLGLIPGLARSPGERNGYPLQSSCLGNPMDRGAWRASPLGPKESAGNWATFTSLHHAMTDIIKEVLNHNWFSDYNTFSFLWKRSVKQDSDNLYLELCGNGIIK